LGTLEEVETMAKMKQIGRLSRDLIGFARKNKAYWIIPMVMVLGLMTLLIVGGQGAAPFIYTLF
jgi:hypothetical protein